MQYKYIEVNLPSNGLIYPIKTVHLRPKTIFDIKSLLGNPAYQIKQEIDTLQNCIDPNDKIDVYDLVNQDVVFLLYKLRSLSDDNLTITYKKKDYNVALSELEVKQLEKWDNKRTLPESKLEVFLAHKPIKDVFNAIEQQQEFINKYPDYNGDVANTVALLNAIIMIDNVTDKDNIRNKLESLSWRDSLYLIQEIENFQSQQFGIVEEIKINDEGKEITLPLQITEEFFRPSL